jgi:hypothetical protein
MRFLIKWKIEGYWYLQYIVLRGRLSETCKKKFNCWKEKEKQKNNKRGMMGGTNRSMRKMKVRMRTRMNNSKSS